MRLPKTPLFRSPLIRIDQDLAPLTDRGEEVEDLSELGLSDQKRDHIWRAVEAWYQTATQPFISLCVRKRGQQILHRSIGHIDGEWSPAGIGIDGRVGSVNTPVCVFSASKALTAMLMHSLAEDQLVDLEQKVSYYLPRFGINGKANITLSDILTHRSGFPQVPTHLPVETLFDFDAVVDALYEVSVPRSTGKRTAYHAITGGHILAAVAREVTGKNLNQLLRKRISIPLKLASLRYGATVNGRKQIAQNYNTGISLPPPFSSIIEQALGAPWDKVVEVSNRSSFLNTIIPSGNAVGNSADWCSLMELMRCGGILNDRRIFKEATVKAATEQATNSWFDQTLKLPIRFSQGFMLGNAPVGLFGPMTKEAFGHLGFINIFCWADPVRETSVALLSTGKSLVGLHLIELAKTMHVLNKNTQG